MTELTTKARRRDFFRLQYVFRSAVTGQYVSRWAALLDPEHTVRERRD